jgi:hypothetical protein
MGSIQSYLFLASRFVKRLGAVAVRRAFWRAPFWHMRLRPDARMSAAERLSLAQFFCSSELPSLPATSLTQWSARGNVNWSTLRLEGPEVSQEKGEKMRGQTNQRMSESLPSRISMRFLG